jgi:hypothetical protein
MYTCTEYETKNIFNEDVKSLCLIEFSFDNKNVLNPNQNVKSILQITASNKINQL